ncbi:MAG: protein-L-isoaspartate(D-aspartate) O-methyltransferase [Gammaproteobacteria bacterium]|nr:protein-L-isoaspartate(D-aspartate) O-methyltransferase [Gammaproteobacteria bacterium]MDE0649380.1 protein-L-isoaspartate(D-aspartate) O-methyltransferase [Gammaproteobacteria bacterium]MXW09700.1 protein-L-isoaspartate(D-aspartate) O-methyltransferase [Gammaproteobacteria bacterium]MYC50718.1 protein-L-isoaspartate(D-aspartate) O-methyltransferase [Gammaproteobacteria bacterium]
MFSRKTKPERFAGRRARMVARQLRRRNIRDEEVLAAMGEVPREHFLPREHRAVAYQDRALPLTGGQTMSQPYMVAAMTEALELSPGQRVLEIGTGSGYQTAILARLAGEVFTIERLPGMAAGARGLLRDAGYENVHVRVGDGTLGWAEKAPFDAILVTAAAPAAPPSLEEQLRPDGGCMVIPVGSRRIQQLVRIRRTPAGTTTERLMECAFVPLMGAEGW